MGLLANLPKCSNESIHPFPLFLLQTKLMQILPYLVSLLFIMC
jgi:hypothetical protein